MLWEFVARGRQRGMDDRRIVKLGRTRGTAIWSDRAGTAATIRAILGEPMSDPVRVATVEEARKR